MKIIFLIFYVVMFHVLIFCTARYCKEYNVNDNICGAILIIEVLLGLAFAYTIFPEFADY